MKILSFLFALLMVSTGFSQYDRHLTNYMFDKFSFNPGTHGFGGLSLTTIGRLQSTGFDYGSKTALLNLDGRLNRIKSGAGLSYVIDRTGYGIENDLKLNFARQFSIMPAMGTLSAGVGLGINSMVFKPTYDICGTSWPCVLPPVGARDLKFDMNLGVFWKGYNTPYYLGISTTHITQPYLEAVNFVKNRHYYLLGGIDISYDLLPIAGPLTIKPSFLAVSDGVTNTFDLNLICNFDLDAYRNVYLGATYRRQDAVAILAGFGFDRSNDIGYGPLGGDPDHFLIGYAYGVPIGQFVPKAKGSHELVLRYNISDH